MKEQEGYRYRIEVYGPDRKFQRVQYVVVSAAADILFRQHGDDGTMRITVEKAPE